MFGVEIGFVPDFKICELDSVTGDGWITECFDNGLGFEVHICQIVTYQVKPEYHFRVYWVYDEHENIIERPTILTGRQM